MILLAACNCIYKRGLGILGLAADPAADECVFPDLLKLNICKDRLDFLSHWDKSRFLGSSHNH